MNRTNYLLFLFLFLLASMDLKALIGGDPRLTRDIVINTNEIVRGIVCSNTPITQSDVGSTGFTITTPGVYFVLENIDFAPAAPASAITISSDDVILDLRCFILSQTNATPGVNGVHVLSGLDNVTIRNGMITDFTGDGILVEDGNSSFVSNDIVLRLCDRGLALEGSLGSPIVDVELTSLDLKSCSTGLAYYFTQEGLVRKCNALANTAAGYDIRTSFSNQFVQCFARNTNASIGSAFGVFVDDGSKNIFEQWRIEGTSTNSTFTGDTATGFFIGSDENNLILKHSQISNSMTTSSAQPFGVQMEYTFTSLNVVSNYILTVTDLPANSVRSVEWTADNRYLAFGTTGEGFTAGTVQVLEFSENELVKIAQFDTEDVNSVAWSPDAKYLAYGAIAGDFTLLEVLEFDGTSLVEAAMLTFTGILIPPPIQSVAWSPDGRYIATGFIGVFAGDIQVRVFEFTGESLEEVATFVHGAANGTAIESVDWSPDGKYLAIGGNSGTGGFEVRVLEFTGTALNDIGANFDHGATILSVNWSLDERYVAIGGLEGTGGFEVRVLEFTGTALNNVANFSHVVGLNINSVNWSPDGKYLAIGGDEGTGGFEVRVLQFTGNSLIPIANFDHGPGPVDVIFSVNWSPNGAYIGIGGNPGADGVHVRVLSGLQFSSGSTIFDNLITCVQGVPLPAGFPGVSNGRGLSASSANNLIIQNTAFNNDINYVFVTTTYEQFLVNIKPQSEVPSTIDNLSFPPL